MRIFSTPEGIRIQLSARERQVLRLAAHGLPSQEIASELAIAESTVKHHLAVLLRALDARNRVQLALWCVCHPEALEGVAVALSPTIPPSISSNSTGNGAPFPVERFK